MAGHTGRVMLAILAMLSMISRAAAVEVCKVVDLQLVTQTGEFFLAVVFLVMGVSTVIFVLMAFKAAHEKRKFYFVTCYITAVATFGYYAMLSGQGWLITPNCRQLFYVRYAEWFVTTPLILLDLAMIASASTSTRITIMAADMMRVFAAFMATISSGYIKWLWFTLSLFILIPLIYVMVRGFKQEVERANHGAVVELYNKVSILSAIVWALYPLVFILAAGTGDWSPNFETMIYGVLDIMSKAVFGFILLLSHEGLDNVVTTYAQVRNNGQFPKYGTAMEARQMQTA